MRGSFKKYWSFYVEGYRYFQLLIATTKQAVVSLFVPKVMFFSCHFTIQTKFVKLSHAKFRAYKTKMFTIFDFCVIK